MSKINPGVAQAIAAMAKQGASTKEIAAALNMSQPLVGIVRQVMGCPAPRHVTKGPTPDLSGKFFTKIVASMVRHHGVEVVKARVDEIAAAADAGPVTTNGADAHAPAA